MHDVRENVTSTRKRTLKDKDKERERSEKCVMRPQSEPQAMAYRRPPPLPSSNCRPSECRFREAASLIAQPPLSPNQGRCCTAYGYPVNAVVAQPGGRSRSARLPFRPALPKGQVRRFASAVRHAQDMDPVLRSELLSFLRSWKEKKVAGTSQPHGPSPPSHSVKSLPDNEACKIKNNAGAMRGRGRSRHRRHGRFSTRTYVAEGNHRSLSREGHQSSPPTCTDVVPPFEPMRNPRLQCELIYRTRSGPPRVSSRLLLRKDSALETTMD